MYPARTRGDQKVQIFQFLFIDGPSIYGSKNNGFGLWLAIFLGPSMEHRCAIDGPIKSPNVFFKLSEGSPFSYHFIAFFPMKWSKMGFVWKIVSSKCDPSIDGSYFLNAEWTRYSLISGLKLTIQERMHYPTSFKPLAILDVVSLTEIIWYTYFQRKKKMLTLVSIGYSSMAYRCEFIVFFVFFWPPWGRLQGHPHDTWAFYLQIIVCTRKMYAPFPNL